MDFDWKCCETYAGRSFEPLEYVAASQLRRVLFSNRIVSCTAPEILRSPTRNHTLRAFLFLSPCQLTGKKTGWDISKLRLFQLCRWLCAVSASQWRWWMKFFAINNYLSRYGEMPSMCRACEYDLWETLDSKYVTEQSTVHLIHLIFGPPLVTSFYALFDILRSV